MFQAVKRIINDESTKLISAIGLTVTAVTLPYIFKFSGYPLSTQTSDWGAFGSYVGGILSPMFAVGSLYYVVKTFRQQSFETTFNLLLEQHNNLADTLSTKRVSHSSDTSSKTEATSSIEDTLKELGNYWLSEKAKHRKSLNDNYEVHKYVRVVYQILKFIDEDCPSDKYKYSRIFRSFLSNDLCLILAMNCAQRSSDNRIAFPKYKHLIEKYHLLEHLILLDSAKPEMFDHAQELSNLTVIAGTYAPSAFGDAVNVEKALTEGLRYYYQSLSCGLKSTSEEVKKHKRHSQFINQKLPKLASLLESQCELSKGDSQVLEDLKQEAINLAELEPHFNNNKDKLVNFRDHFQDVRGRIDYSAQLTRDTLEKSSFYKERQFASALCKCESTSLLHQFLDGIMPAILEELDFVEAEISDTIEIALVKVT